MSELKSLCENSFLLRVIERGTLLSTIYCGESIEKVSQHTDSKAPTPYKDSGVEPPQQARWRKFAKLGCFIV
jgi:hypothetical protein